MSVKFANFARTTLAGAVDQLATAIPVVDASVFPPLTESVQVLPNQVISPYFYAALQHPLDRTVELVKVTAVDTNLNQLTVERGAEGTSPLSFPIDSMCEQRITAASLNEAFIEATGDQILSGSLIIAHPYSYGGMDSTGATFAILKVDEDDEVVVGDFGRRVGIAATGGEAWVIEEAGNPAKQYRLFHENFTPTWSQVEGEDYLVQNGAEETKTVRERLRIGSSDTSAILPAANAVGQGAWSSIGLSNAWFAHGWFTQLHSDMTSINQAPTQPEHGVNKAYLESDAARWKQYARGEAELNAVREANRNQFAASGDVHFGKHRTGVAGTQSINEGMYSYFSTQLNVSNKLFLGRDDTGTNDGESESNWPVKHVAGFISEVLTLNDERSITACAHTIKFDQAPDGRDTFNVTTGERIRHADVATAFAAAAADPDVEVVTDRHDMFGGEFFLEAITEVNPFVYPKGMIQSQAAEINGITTTRSNRPVTYYAVFDGDADSAGLGVDFWSATAEEKIAMLSDESNNLFIIKDEFGMDMLVQWRMRQRTINGAGNGDWENIDPNRGVDLQSVYSGSTSTSLYLKPQGALDYRVPLDNDVGSNDGSGYGLYTWDWRIWPANWNANTGRGKFNAAKDGNDIAVNGECYFQVWGIIPRLSQAAFVKGVSENGAATGADGLPWYESASDLSTLENAFLNAANGDMLSGISGRDDGKFFDVIYSSGQGGVNDERVTAWDMGSKEEASKIFQKVVNGTYLGEERLLHTHVNTSSETGIATGAVLDLPLPPNLQSGGTIAIVNAAGTTIDMRRITAIDYTLNAVNWDIAADRPSGAHYMVSAYKKSSVSGEFTFGVVVGDPAEVLATSALSNGWDGGWSPTIPDGSTRTVLPRKSLVSSDSQQWTDDNGVTWGSGSGSVNTNTNTLGQVSAGRVLISHYTAFAKQTKESVNKKVLNSYSGIGEVFASLSLQPTWGGLLGESLVGKVLTGNADRQFESLGLTGKTVFSSGEIANWSAHTPRHEPLGIGNGLSSTGNGQAFKALWYQTSDNQQCGLNFAWNELVYNPPQAAVTFSSSTSQAFEQGKMYLCTDGRLSGNLFHCFSSGSSTINDYGITADGELTPNGVDNHALISPFKLSKSQWGDDSTVRITNGTGTFTNLNGDTCLMGSAELTKRYGYTKNRARAGTQIGGVDL